MIKTINLPYQISGTKIYIPFNSTCSISNKKFKGTIIIEYVPSNLALEYIDVENYIKIISKNKQTAEDLTHSIFEEIKSSIKPTYLKVLINITNSKAHKPAKVWVES